MGKPQHDPEKQWEDRAYLFATELVRQPWFDSKLISGLVLDMFAEQPVPERWQRIVNQCHTK